ncbi:MAG TPA: polyhydroxyalkanoate synthesis regulator DNA-binding domain-containing protein [Bryobacteraceae bacterium]|nr:polyhydroxyalkanoate synthesis regulator DNA-binding domain-containing protein [Bryobacteraceae bacterium]
MRPSKVVIRKYGNRRLYDTSASRYVNLDDVAVLIRKGIDVEVRDAKTGEDLTRVVLTQIIVEDAKEQPTGLPLELLRQIILVSDRARQEFLMWYLKSAFDAFGKFQDAVQSGLHEVGTAALSPLQTIKHFLTPGESERDAEVADLRRKIAELEARLEKPARKR